MVKGSTIIEGLHNDIPSAVYHGLEGTFSSSQLKDALKDIEYFHKKHIAKEVERESNSAFDMGTHFHTYILEPEKIEEECAIFGGVRRGKDWEQFKLDNANKCIITSSEKETVDTLVNAVRKSPVAMGRINRSESEVSAFLKIRVVGTSVYAIEWKKVLGKYGWEECKSIPSKGRDLWVKCRADKWNESFILDLKSTTGNAKDEFSMRQKVSMYSYDLSAAMYLDVFSAANQKPVFEFIWTFASKDYGNSRSYMASQKNILVGRAKWKKAIVAIAEGFDTEWKFEDYMGILEPQNFELEYIADKAEDDL